MRFRANIIRNPARISDYDPSPIEVVAFDPTKQVDRWEHAHAWGLPAHKGRLAERLVDAIQAGKVLTGAKVATDVNGRTYWDTSCQVLGRKLNADLRRLGF